MSRSKIAVAITATAALVAALVVTFVPLTASADTVPEGPSVEPAPTGLGAEILGANGSGCPATSPTSVMAHTMPDGSITLAYDTFTVTGGDYKTCVVIIRMAVPDGWTYSIPMVQNVAWAELDAGASAKLQTNAWFTGLPWTVTDTETATGPYYDTWDTLSHSESLVWAPCGEPLNMNIAETVRVSGPSSNAVTLMASIVLRPHWRQC